MAIPTAIPTVWMDSYDVLTAKLLNVHALDGDRKARAWL